MFNESLPLTTSKSAFLFLPRGIFQALTSRRPSYFTTSHPHSRLREPGKVVAAVAEKMETTLGSIEGLKAKQLNDLSVIGARLATIRLACEQVQASNPIASVFRRLDVVTDDLEKLTEDVKIFDRQWEDIVHQARQEASEAREAALQAAKDSDESNNEANSVCACFISSPSGHLFKIRSLLLGFVDIHTDSTNM